MSASRPSRSSTTSPMMAAAYLGSEEPETWWVDIPGGPGSRTGSPEGRSSDAAKGSAGSSYGTSGGLLLDARPGASSWPGPTAHHNDDTKKGPSADDEAAPDADPPTFVPTPELAPKASGKGSSPEEDVAPGERSPWTSSQLKQPPPSSTTSALTTTDTKEPPPSSTSTAGTPGPFFGANENRPKPPPPTSTLATADAPVGTAHSQLKLPPPPSSVLATTTDPSIDETAAAAKQGPGVVPEPHRAAAESQGTTTHKRPLQVRYDRNRNASIVVNGGEGKEEEGDHDDHDDGDHDDGDHDDDDDEVGSTAASARRAGNWDSELATGSDDSRRIPLKKEEEVDDYPICPLAPPAVFKLPHCPVCDCPFDTDVTLRQNNYTDMRKQHKLPVSCHKCSQVECYRCVATRMANLWDEKNDHSRRVKHLSCSLCGDPCGHYFDQEPMTIHPERFNAISLGEAFAASELAEGSSRRSTGSGSRRRTRTSAAAAASSSASALSQTPKKGGSVSRPDRLLICLPLINIIREINENTDGPNASHPAAGGKAMMERHDTNLNQPGESRRRTPEDFPESSSHCERGVVVGSVQVQSPKPACLPVLGDSPHATSASAHADEISVSFGSPSLLSVALASAQDGDGRTIANANASVGHAHNEHANHDEQASPQQSPSPFKLEKSRNPKAIGSQTSWGTATTASTTVDVDVAIPHPQEDAIQQLIEDNSKARILIEGGLHRTMSIRKLLEQRLCVLEMSPSSDRAVAVYGTEADAFAAWKSATRVIEKGFLKLYLPRDVTHGQALVNSFAPMSVIGLKVRKSFPNHEIPFDPNHEIPFDGRIVRYISPNEEDKHVDYNDDDDDGENSELWGVLFEDGDREDFNREEVVCHRQLFLDHMKHQLRDGKQNFAPPQQIGIIDDGGITLEGNVYLNAKTQPLRPSRNVQIEFSTELTPQGDQIFSVSPALTSPLSCQPSSPATKLSSQLSNQLTTPTRTKIGQDQNGKGAKGSSMSLPNPSPAAFAPHRNAASGFMRFHPSRSKRMAEGRAWNASVKLQKSTSGAITKQSSTSKQPATPFGRYGDMEY